MRLRSRWLKIAAVVVVLIGGMWWVTRPILDPRFVGTWDLYESDVENPTSLEGLETPTKEIFSADGQFAQSVGGVVQDLAIWRVDDGSHLILRKQLSLLEQLKAIAQQVRAKFVGEGDRPYGVSYQFRVISADRIAIRESAVPGDSVVPQPFFILERVSPADPVR